MNVSISKILKCRLCDSSDLTEFIDLGQVALGNNLQTNVQKAKAAEQFPLNVNRCQSCDHFQLGYEVSSEILYATNYTYLSGVGKSFIKHIENYAHWVQNNCIIQKSAFVVDIGSNDGTCLKAFQALGFKTLGVDPASFPAKIANENGIKTFNCFFDTSAMQNILKEFGHADIVTSQNVLAHVENLRSIFNNIYFLLKKNGYFVFEIGYFQEVLKTGCFDTIYHEHKDYHHAAPLAMYLCSLGFDLINLSSNDVQGGSLRLLLRKTGNGNISKQAKEFIAEEKKSLLYDNAFLSRWPVKIRESIGSFEMYIKNSSKKGLKIVGYGAPTKATLLMKLAKLTNNDIDYIVEDNELKVGRFLPESSIPILDTSRIEKDEPDIIIILAWNFSSDIIKKLRGYLKFSVKIIIPLPTLKVINL